MDTPPLSCSALASSVIESVMTFTIGVAGGRKATNAAEMVVAREARFLPGLEERLAGEGTSGSDGAGLRPFDEGMWGWAEECQLLMSAVCGR